MSAREASQETDDDDRFPYQQLAVLALCRLAEPIAFVSIVSYSFVMVQDIKGEKDASFYSGLLISAFAVCEASTAMMWGALSDKYGRKPIIMIALAGTAISSLIFGLAKNYWVALLARAIGGGLNGNLAVMQTMVTEVVKKPEHEPKAYALQPFMWFLGSIAGSSLGGFTAQPAHFYPELFDPNGIFGQFPYLLPNLVAIAVILVAMTLGGFLLKETNPAVVSRSKRAPETSETTPLRAGEHSISKRRRSRHSYGAVSMPTPNDPDFDLRRPSIGTISSIKMLVEGTKPADASAIEEEPIPEATAVKAFNKEVVGWIIVFGFMSYQQMGFVTELPIYLLDDPGAKPQHLDLTGGLGLTLHDVGVYLAFNSVIALFVQGAVFPVYVAVFGVYGTVLSLALLAPLVQSAMPFVSLLVHPNIGIYLVLFLQACCAIISYPTLLILLKNATESSLVLGRVNGLAMSVCCFARTIAPPAVGIVYSAYGSAAGWWSCAIASVFAIVAIFAVPRTKRNDKEILERASTSAMDS